MRMIASLQPLKKSANPRYVAHASCFLLVLTQQRNHRKCLIASLLHLKTNTLIRYVVHVSRFPLVLTYNEGTITHAFPRTSWGTHEHRISTPVVDVAALAETAILPSMRNTMEFILALKAASLDDPIAKLSQDALERLRDPPGHLIPIEDWGTRFSISTYLALENSSQVVYNRVCNAARKEFFDSRGIDTLLSFHNVEKVIASHTGVVSVEHDMSQ